MGKETGIEWTNHTMNFWWGCYKVSPGCKHCYAETLSNRMGNDIWGLHKPRRVFKPSHYNQPLVWNKAAEESGIRARVFCGSMMDWAEDYRPNNPQPAIEGKIKLTWDIEHYRQRMFEMIEQTPYLDWQLLTKRSGRIMEVVPYSWKNKFPDNVWPMVSVESQAQAYRLADLCAAPAKIRGASIEPLIGPLDIRQYLGKDKINWIIIGGESGHGARRLDIDWVTDLVAQGQESGISVFVKQLGSVYHREHGTTHKKAGDPNEWPSLIQVREFPNV